MSKTYRVGIIGSTNRGNYGHGLDNVWRDIEQGEVVAVADDHAEGLAAAVERTGAGTGYADYHEMLKREQLDIVTIAPRWINQHRDMVLAAAEQGCHIYLEKPFCRSLEEADEIVNACEMRHIKLAIAHTNRYSPTRFAVEKLIADGVIGDVLELRARGKEDRRGGAEDLWVLGTHMLDLMRAFAGDVASCYATMSENGQPVTKSHVQTGREGLGPLAGDFVNARYTFQNNMVGYFGSKRNRKGEPSRFGIQIFGSKGVVEITSGYAKTAYLLKDPAWSPGRTGSEWVPVSSQGIGKPETIEAGHNAANIAALTDLIESIETDRQPKSSVYDARAATEMIFAVFESHRQQGPVTFPLQNRKHPLTMLEG